MTAQHHPTAPNDPLRVYAAHYPDVVRSGSLRDALQGESDRGGHGLTVELTPSPGWRHSAATVAAEGRSAMAHMALEVRSFSVDCWSGGIHMATGSTDDLSAVAGAMSTWLRASRVRDLVTEWPLMRTWELAEAHERGEAVPTRWRQLREATGRPQDSALHQLVEAAFAQPALRALSPGRSTYWLTFSRRAAPPICHDLPRVRPLRSGGYLIACADGRQQETNEAAEAVALIVAALPDDVRRRPEGP
ncbi:DUF6193 family natural product biosynthesis protein [Streptomyces sp. NPDC059651]|uniref:DUF6193 family natural product biosynthesis protein n=1 Tax=Streptomyces sp. NPDC059651 TaxID=3346897 RepID=UPI00368CE1F7